MMLAAELLSQSWVTTYHVPIKCGLCLIPHHSPFKCGLCLNLMSTLIQVHKCKYGASSRLNLPLNNALQYHASLPLWKHHPCCTGGCSWRFSWEGRVLRSESFSSRLPLACSLTCIWQVATFESPQYWPPVATFFLIHRQNMTLKRAWKYNRFAAKVLYLVISKRRTDGSSNNFLHQVR